EMDEAPADGYRPALEIDPDRTGPIYFFVRIDGLYGKGKVTPVRLERTGAGRQVTAAVELFVNPDGEPNLESAW
ncbi:MAG: hypothetical protein AAGF23_09990, partial [Acidobacteriota bacterium]